MTECIDYKDCVGKGYRDKFLQALDVARKVADGRCSLSSYVWRFGEEHIDDIFMPLIEEHREELHHIIDRKVRKLESVSVQKEIYRIRENIKLVKEVISDTNTSDEEKTKLNKIMDKLNRNVNDLGSTLYKLSIENEI